MKVLRGLFESNDLNSLLFFSKLLVNEREKMEELFMDIFEELKNKRPEDCQTAYIPEKITKDDVEEIENEAAYKPNRDDLYSLISEVHDLFVKAAEENKVSYDTPTDYYEGKAFAYGNAAYIIEEKMKKLYTKGE